MMPKLAQSPVAPETRPAMIRIKIEGSTRRLPILAKSLRRVGSTATLRLTFVSRRAASWLTIPAAWL